MFFNSSTSNDATNDFNSRCSTSDACSMDDLTLRGSTAYPESALEVWQRSKSLTSTKIAAVVLSVVSASLTALLLFHATWKRWRQPKQPKKGSEPTASASSSMLTTPAANEKILAGFDSSHEGMDPSLRWKDSASTLGMPGAYQTTRTAQSDATLGANGPVNITFDPSKQLPQIPAQDNKKSAYSVDVKESSKRPILTPGVSLTATGATKPPPKARIDYLAGLVALSSLLVTIIHFGLTFAPAIVTPGAPVHYHSEVITEKTVGPIFLSFSWVGIFFTTSTRFLVANYLKNGDLKNIAEKTVGRTPRLMIPVAAVALLEYFVMNCGGTHWLEFLPSVTWSTWPFTTIFPTFGDFFSDILELLYLIPNAAPQITFHYCTGVLWTIPVQLQGTWLMLLGVIVIREIKTPWKRFAYYLMCIITNWYARSWGMFLWLGLIITDLDVTYKYKSWIYARPHVHYTTICGLFMLTSLAIAPDVIAQWSSWTFSIKENNIHPDQATGRPIGQTINAGYPAYFNPRFSALVFVTGFQLMVELSTWFQYILSFPLLMKLFPHILTIYLVHGLVFWTLGSWVCVTLAGMGIPYWANLMVVAACCYSTIFLSLTILTPVIETLGRLITTQIWEFAHHGGAPRQRSLYPFPKDLFFNSDDFRKSLDGDKEIQSNLKRATIIASAEEEKARAEQFPHLDRSDEIAQHFPLPTTPVLSERGSWSHFSTGRKSSHFQDETTSQASEREYEVDNHFRREMTQQRISRIQSIGSNNPFRDSFKDEIAELERLKSRDSSRRSGRSIQRLRKSAGSLSNYVLDEIVPPSPSFFREEMSRIRSLSESTNSYVLDEIVPPSPSFFREEMSRFRSSSSSTSNDASNDNKNDQRSVSVQSAVTIWPGASSPKAEKVEKHKQQPQSTNSPSNPPQTPQWVHTPRQLQRPIVAYQQPSRLPRPPRETPPRSPLVQEETRPARPRLAESGQSSSSGWSTPTSWMSQNGHDSVSRFTSPTGRPLPAPRLPAASSQTSLPRPRGTAHRGSPRNASPRPELSNRSVTGLAPGRTPIHPPRSSSAQDRRAGQSSPPLPSSSRRGGLS
jgi:hypothetical protein